MSSKLYRKLSVLIADDFSSFRTAVSGMLSEMGVRDIHMAANGMEAIESCADRFFDVVLCDYNLGPGRSGQHVLEELRHRKILTHKNIFIMVSAEASRNVVMSTYDCEPDDYLMKPVTAMMLQQRMQRLVATREALGGVYYCLDRGDEDGAVDLLTEMSLSDSRYSVVAQKLLGKLFIERGDLGKAEKLYTRTLEMRQLDWARLGLAKVKHLKGEVDVAGEWLEQIVTDNPLYLPGYDVLAENWEARGNKINVQRTVEQAVEISPMSILRQKRLSGVARENNDIETSIKAMRNTLKLGELSCHGSVEDHLEFARLASEAIERDLEGSNDIGMEAIQALDEAKERFELTEAQIGQCALLQSQIHAMQGDTAAAVAIMEKASDILRDQDTGIEVELDRVSALLSVGEKEQANALLEALKVKYVDDQASLEKLDEFLNEPASESNRAMVAAVNREGIDLYNAGSFDEALVCFERASKIFPKHVGIQLNIVQALIGKLRAGDTDETVAHECHAALELLSSLIDMEHPQFERYSRLRAMAISL